MLQIIFDYAMIHLVDAIAEITGIHVVKISVILPATLHDLVLEYTSQRYRPIVGFVDEVIGICYLATAALGQHVDVFVLATFAQEDPITHTSQFIRWISAGNSR